eukprot:TRINITY_DN3322_c1_g1_i1.p1 TRINITY_DN3322_c1_g1~~TRINITY_DN3322_c1_g1_i1.p1  ORF type:complete len:231 (+),score=67.58 TRINITY_DN3322_c1_g1_i1:115-807(+)
MAGYLVPVLSEPPSWLVSDTDPDAAAKNDIIVDLIVQCLRFALGHGFSEEKASALVSIVFHIHVTSMDRCLSNVESFALFQAYMVQHSVHRPPYSIEVFDIADVQLIAHFVTDTYFAQYKLYLFAFAPQRSLSLTTVTFKDVVETARPPPPLAEALPEEEWRRLEAERNEAAAVAAGLPAGLGAQLRYVRSLVEDAAAERLADLEAKEAALEIQLAAAGRVPPDRQPDRG